MAYFAKFTERGQRALIAAQREAAQLGRTYVGTEHLLLGVLTEPGGAVSVLRGITLEAVRAEVVQILGRGDDNVQGKQMVLTPRTKKVIEQSMREARDLKQNYVSTEHLLLALMREREGVAAHVLIKMGMDLSKARDELLRILTGAEDDVPGAPESAAADTPILNQFSRDLTAGARHGELDPVVGRENEIERIVQILSR
ncbi:MAG: ATP-dependent Clp protease ATP-binding subunit ClpC, partial [Clostridia bacterium]|nr:ATP-dependent Clp protease ATP-binding subunit ClpC [Clostridia bacterium]